MNLEKICIGCMKEKGEERICPNCGMCQEEYRKEPRELPPLTVLQGKYLLGKVLGSGGFGITYLALDLLLERPVAIKEFFLEGCMFRDTRQGPEIGTELMSAAQMRLYRLNKARFDSEARSLAKLDQMEGIVKIYDYFDENLTCYLVMEYLEGMTLEKAVRKKTMTFHQTVELLDPILRSLEQLHRNGLIHRDISPDNIMLLGDGTARLFDFGGVKLLDRQASGQSAYVLMKGGYSPPEQLQPDSSQGPWTDVYAMAATMYFCISGRQPLKAAVRISSSEPLKRMKGKNCSIKSAQEAVILKGMTLSCKHRYQSMEEFEKALLRADGRKVPHDRKPAFFRVSGGRLAGAVLAAFLSGAAMLSLLGETEHPDGEKEKLPEPGYYMIASELHEGMVLCASEEAEGASVRLWKRRDANMLEWFYLEENQDGSFRIITKQSGLSLDVRDGSDVSGAVLQLAGYVDAPGQEWYLRPSGEDTWYIVSSLGTAVDLAEGKVKNGARVGMYELHGEKNQSWKLIRVG